MKKILDEEEKNMDETHFMQLFEILFLVRPKCVFFSPNFPNVETTCVADLNGRSQCSETQRLAGISEYKWNAALRSFHKPYPCPQDSRITLQDDSQDTLPIVYPVKRTHEMFIKCN